MSGKRAYVIIASFAIGVLLLTPVFGTGPNFIADSIFKGSSLTGWHVLGQADWKAQNGEITGTPRQPGGGWLVLDASFADVAFFADVHCTGVCKAGVLLRAEQTKEGIKGVFVSLAEGDLATYAVKIDPQGREVSREKLPASAGEGGLASPMGNSSPALMAAVQSGQGLISVPPLPPNVNLPGLAPPTGVYRPGAWNQVELILYGDTLKPSLNEGALSITGKQPGGLDRTTVPGEAGKYGRIALYVGGSGEAHFRDIRYKNLDEQIIPKEEVSPNFRMQRLSEYYFSWSAAVADVNHDGVPDVIAGPYVYLGPDYTTAKEIYTPMPYNPATDYPQTSIVSLAYDFTGDGWPDVLVMSGNAGLGTGTLYVNPRNERRHWDKFVVIQPVGNEETLLKDIDGDGQPEVIHSGNNTLRYSKPDPKNPTGTWITRTISEPGPWGANIGHGLGVGDINGDGRMDYVTPYGWWEQPPKGSRQELWTWHPEAFGRWGHSQGGAGGAELGVYDVNGDGLNDVVTSLEGHGFGLAWYEQKKTAEGGITFIEHIIMDNFETKNAGDVMFTEPHATAFADIDGDGIPDLITGKRPMSHLFGYTDPDPFGTPVLYVYRTVRNPSAPGGAEFVPELVHNRSGVGAHFAVADLNGDGMPDIVTSAVHGTFIFFNNMKPRAGATKASARP